MEKESIKVQCQECYKIFKTKKMVPECPSCNGLDIDLYYGNLYNLYFGKEIKHGT